MINKDNFNLELKLLLQSALLGSITIARDWDLNESFICFSLKREKQNLNPVLVWKTYLFDTVDTHMLENDFSYRLSYCCLKSTSKKRLLYFILKTVRIHKFKFENLNENESLLIKELIEYVTYCKDNLSCFIF